MSDWKLLVGEDGHIVWSSILGTPKSMESYKLHWKDNWVWEDTLTYSGYSRGTSSCIICFKSETLNQYVNMFMTDFNYIVNKLEKGKISGAFTFCKRGQNYGVKFIK